MKGIIDVQIKHKDGSIETRHEHNVVFDLQAIATKLFYSRPYGPMTGRLAYKTISSSTYSNFSLSTLELDLTRPSVAIPALNSITSGSSSVWYTAPITSTIEAKYRISSATWTIGEAMTLKSIFFPYSGLMFVRDPAGNGSSSSYRRCLLHDDGLFYTSANVTRLTSPSENFKFTNSYLSGFANTYYNSSELNVSSESVFVPYKLHDTTERFVFHSATSDNVNYYPYAGGELQIKDAATNVVKRSFNISQFANLLTGNFRYLTRVVNTGSKNLLLQPVSGATDGIRVWEIPDTATTETIQPSGIILTNQSIYLSTNCYETFVVADNVLMFRPSSNSSRMICARINDDLSVDVVPGANAAGLDIGTYPSDSYNNVIFPYMNTDSPWFYRDVGTEYTFTSGGTYNYRFFNSTAANFSTPIVLAQGDVLTVSYKIEVA